MILRGLSVSGSLSGDPFWFFCFLFVCVVLCSCTGCFYKPGDPRLFPVSGLVGCPDLAIAGLDPCRGVLEISCHPLPSRLKGVPLLDLPATGCASVFTSLHPLHWVYSALLLHCVLSLYEILSLWIRPCCRCRMAVLNALLPLRKGNNRSYSTRTIIISVSGSALIVGVLLLVHCIILRQRKAKETIESEDEMIKWQCRQYDFATVQAATNNFSEENKLGQGGFGTVYKGRLPNIEQDVAVKRLSGNSRQGDTEFMNEVLLLVKLYHRNLVKFLGFCLEGMERILIYEFLPNSSLDQFIFGRQYQAQIRGLNAYDRHKKFLNDYVAFYGKDKSQHVKLPVKTDQDTLREGYRFIRSEEDDQNPAWEQRLVKRYYDKLFKEYCIADMSQYKSGKIGLRWRTEKEVISGKGKNSISSLTDLIKIFSQKF
ncbi:hypothetical protein SLEP1_g2868 [Rubroshorea leprosula]|uniref:Protein kinase domain-containing protein n=1 Tax=Rubroshorea leprosula TaxID=152421 RepID=A0AAV5HMX3_9ROSI|nr:hypothetical protein SLEP1_g2868 [Rubroshorea leprosula]